MYISGKSKAQRVLFHVKLALLNLVQKLHLEVAQQFFSALVPAQKDSLQVHCHCHCSCFFVAGFVSRQMKSDQKVKKYVKTINLREAVVVQVLSVSSPLSRLP